jgi:hypothetical protein
MAISRFCVVPMFLLACVALLASCSDSEPSTAVACARDSDCGLGSLCIADRCEAGCNSPRDCPATAPLCDPALSENGNCVKCLTDDQCGRGESCSAGSCIAACSKDSDCAADLHCNTDTKRCVACLVSAQCALGEVCSVGNECKPGCFGDRDCSRLAPFCTGASPTEPGQCVECTEQRDCGVGKACVNNACVASCSNNRDCPGQVCDVTARTCVDCVTTANCELGSICSQQECVAGCESSRDCTTAKPVCDPAAGENGTCFQCTATRDCTGGKTCVSNVCTAPGVAGEGESCAVKQCDQGLSCDPFDSKCRAICLSVLLPCTRLSDVCGHSTDGVSGFCIPGI